MEYGTGNIDDLIAKELAGEASQAEKAWLQNWKNQSTENRQYYAESARVMGMLEALTPEIKVDVDKAWSKLQARKNKSETKIIPLFGRKNASRIAAAVALFIVIAIVV